MSSRTAKWVSRTSPGVPPPLPSRAPSAPPPTVYPESSVSNPYASRYTGRPSRSFSTPSSNHSRSRSESLRPLSSHHSSHHTSPSSYHTSRSGSVREYPMQVHYAQSEEPIIARTSSASGRTNSYMIIPPAGQKVEILHPSPTRSTYVSPSYVSQSSQKERPLIKRLFDKVEWNGSSASRSAPSSRTRTLTKLSRRNSTGSDGRTTVVTSNGTRITNNSGRTYSVHYV